MQSALKKRRGRSTTPREPKPVGGLIKFFPPSYTDRVSASKHMPQGVIGHIVNQPVVILSNKVDENGCVRISKLASINKGHLKLLSNLENALMTRFIPFEQSEPHPATGDIVLRVARGTKKYLPSDPYIDIGETTLVPFQKLRDHNGARNGRKKLSLAPESYVQLAEMWANRETAKKAWRLGFLCFAMFLVVFGTGLLLFGVYRLGA